MSHRKNFMLGIVTAPDWFCHTRTTCGAPSVVMHVKDYVIEKVRICGADGRRAPKRAIYPRYGNDKKEGKNYFLRELKVHE